MDTDDLEKAAAIIGQAVCGQLNARTCMIYIEMPDGLGALTMIGEADSDPTESVCRVIEGLERYKQHKVN